ncbi:MAG: hypothetical protein AAGE37_06160 [Pseudomonadota bacterium]
MMLHYLGRLIAWLTPVHREKWAQAMQAEISAFDNRTDAMKFALGCLIACCRFQLEVKISTGRNWSKILKDRFTISAIFCGVTACLIGLAYLFLSGAPVTMVAVNTAAMLLGVCLAVALILSVPVTPGFLNAIALFGSLGLLGTATLGYAIEGATRWVLVGPFFVQTSLILLPLIALGFARIQNVWTTMSIVLASLAMAIQPDRAMAAMLFAAVAVICWIRPGKLTFGAAFICASGFLVTLLLPDRLSAVPFVDHILWTAFDVSTMTGLALWIGCLALIGPIFCVPPNERTVVHYTFAACWMTLIAAAAMGAYPTPVVGYGASAIIGYFLSLVFLQPARQSCSERKASAPNMSDTGTEDSSFQRNNPSFAVIS